MNVTKMSPTGQQDELTISTQNLSVSPVIKKTDDQGSIALDQAKSTGKEPKTPIVHNISIEKIKKNSQDPQTVERNSICEKVKQLIMMILIGLKNLICKPVNFIFKVKTQDLRPVVLNLIEHFKKDKNNFNEVGIFRLQAPHVSQLDNWIKKLKVSPSDPEILNQLEPLDIAVLLKRLYGDMQLFSKAQLQKDFIAIASLVNKDPAEMITNLKELIKPLSDAQKENLKTLLDFLFEVSKSSDKNKMLIKNLAIVVGPRLCPIPMDNPTEAGKFAMLIPVTTQKMIEYRKEIFE